MSPLRNSQFWNRCNRSYMDNYPINPIIHLYLILRIHSFTPSSCCFIVADMASAIYLSVHWIKILRQTKILHQSQVYFIFLVCLRKWKWWSWSVILVIRLRCGLYHDILSRNSNEDTEERPYGTYHAVDSARSALQQNSVKIDDHEC